MDSLVDSMKQEDIKKLTKTKNSGLIIGAILLVISVLLAFLIVKLFNNKEIESYYELGINGTDKAGTYAYIDLESCQMFASETVDSDEYGYYYAFDTNEMLYIICMSEDKFDEIYRQYNADPDNFIYRFSGYLYEADDELKWFACEMLQECFELDYSVSVDEYDDYFLSTYLDGSRSQTSGLVAFLAIITISTFAVGLYFVFKTVFATIAKIASGGSTEIRNVCDDIENCSDYFSDSEVILTDNYLANTYKNPVAIRYENILWVYSHPTNIHGKIYYQIVVCTRKKNFVVGLFETSERVNEVLEMIQKHNCEILVGYTRENIFSYEQLRKNK